MESLSDVNFLDYDLQKMEQDQLIRLLMEIKDKSDLQQRLIDVQEERIKELTAHFLELYNMATAPKGLIGKIWILINKMKNA